MPLDPQTAHLPLAYGLHTKADPRALRLPALAGCQNVQFDEEGGLQTRKPFAAMPLSIVGGGEVSDLRKIVANGNELVLFTKDTIYSWSERDSGWVSRQAYVAPKVAERSVFSRADDQVYAERAELDGVEVVVWVEKGAAETMYIAATDVETGAVLLSPTTAGGAGHAAIRPHVVAQATQFLVTYFDDNGNTIEAYQLDPADLSNSLAAGMAATTTIGINADGIHDVAVAANGDAYIAMTQLAGAGYLIARLTDAAVLTTRSIGRAAARIGVAVAPGTTEIVVIRHNVAGALIQGDRLNPTTLADVGINVSLGAPLDTTVNQIACAYRSVADSGQFRCYAYWSCGETTNGLLGPNFVTELNYIDTAGATGSKFIVSRHMGVASRAFDYLGRVFVWLAFGGESQASGMGLPLTLRAALQSSYFLYRDTGSSHTAAPIAKAIADRGGGFQFYSGHVANVQALSETEFAWAGVERRIIQLGENQTGYSARGPRVVMLELDSDEARRTARLGRTLYVSGGQVMQYDGVGLVEVGFHVAPYAFQTTTLAGALPAGTYNSKWSLSWTNDAHERERSTTVAAAATAIAASNKISYDGPPNLFATGKKNLRHAPAHENWRTAMNPPTGAPFHLTTSVNPATLAGDNRYVPNDPTAAKIATYNDNVTDAVLLTKEAYPENAGVLANLPPAVASIIVPTPDRLILGGLADDPNRLAYSKLRGVDEVAAFNGDLIFDMPPDGGPVTAIAFHAETMVVFKETAIYAVPNDGFDNLGQGQNYGPARLISSDLGAVSQEAVALTPQGLLFKSRKGWYVMAGWQPQYVGSPVAGFDDDDIVAITVVESQHQVRILSAQRMLVWDYEVNREQGGAWSDWTIEGGRSSVMWQGQHLIIAEGSPGADEAVLRQTDFGDPDVLEAYSMDVETAWVKLADLQGYQRIWKLMVLGEYRSAHRLRIRLKRDYDDSTFFDNTLWTVSPTTVGGPLQVRHSPSIQQCQAMKVRITAENADFSGAPPGEALKLTGVSFQYGVPRGLFRRLPAAQMQ